MEQIRRETLGDQLHRLVRARILSGELPASSRVTQNELAQEMGVSRIPVRDALRRLEAEGLLTSDELGRYTVVGFDVQDAREIYPIRRRLETLALELAVERFTPAKLAALRRLVDRMGQAAEAGDADEYIELDTQFHHALYDASGNARLVKAIRSMWVGIPRLVPLKLPQRMRDSHAQHQEILRLIESGEGRRAVKELDSHIQSAFEELMADLLARQESSAAALAS